MRGGAAFRGGVISVRQSGAQPPPMNQRRSTYVSMSSMGLRAHGWRIAVASLIVSAMLLCGGKPAQAGDLQPELEVAIHLKILSFDDGLKDRVSGNTVVIAVLYPAKNEAGVGEYVAAI